MKSTGMIISMWILGIISLAIFMILSAISFIIAVPITLGFIILVSIKMKSLKIDTSK